MRRGSLRPTPGVGYRMSDGKRVVIGLWGLRLTLWLRLRLLRLLISGAAGEGGEREKQKRAAEGDGSSGSMSCGSQLREIQARALVRAGANVLGSIVPGEMRAARCAASER